MQSTESWSARHVLLGRGRRVITSIHYDLPNARNTTLLHHRGHGQRWGRPNFQTTNTSIQSTGWQSPPRAHIGESQHGGAPKMRLATTRLPAVPTLAAKLYCTTPRNNISSPKPAAKPVECSVKQVAQQVSPKHKQSILNLMQMRRTQRQRNHNSQQRFERDTQQGQYRLVRSFGNLLQCGESIFHHIQQDRKSTHWQCHKEPLLQGCQAQFNIGAESYCGQHKSQRLKILKINRSR